MIDFNKITISRLKDKASPTHLNWMDYIRTAWILRNRKIQSGRNIIFKKGIQISICETGRLFIGDNAFFNENCYILLTMPQPKVEIGKWVFAGRNTIIASKNSIKIGDYTIIAPNCYFIDHEHGFSKNDVIHNQLSVLKEVTIGRDCFFGAGTMVLGGSNVRDGAVIGANSVVTGNIPPYEIWAGNPAKFIKNRE